MILEDRFGVILRLYRRILFIRAACDEEGDHQHEKQRREDCLQERITDDPRDQRQYEYDDRQSSTDRREGALALGTIYVLILVRLSGDGTVFHEIFIIVFHCFLNESLV